MFGRKPQSEPDQESKHDWALRSENDELIRKNRKLRDDLDTLSHEKKIAEEDIKHMVKLKEERLEIEHQKRLNDMVLEKSKDIATIKDEYRDKLEEFLQAQVKDMRKMYEQILNRLPDINVSLKGNINDGN